MAMFIKKLAEKASQMYNNHHGSSIGCGINGLRAQDVKPRLDFHYGVPPNASCLAYDPLRHILALSTRNGQIKLFCVMDNTQALLESREAVPSKFMQFMENRGILLRVTDQNQIEVWNIDEKKLSHVYNFGEEISSFSVVQQTSYMYVGDCNGDVTVLQFDEALQCVVQIQYKIPFSESHGTSTEGGKMTDVAFVSAQPLAEGKRVLIIFRDGLINLWGVQESKIIYTAGCNNALSHQEPKTVTSASWACTHGSKIVVGYSSGDIFLWSIPVISDKHIDEASSRKELCPQTIPHLKLNLGYKMDKTPIVSLRWFSSDRRTSHLYTFGSSNIGPSSVQVIVLNDDSESRIVKLALPLFEPCLAMEIISCISNQSKNSKNALLLLLKSGCLCLFDNSDIEHFLSQSQSKSSPTPPKNLMIKLPFGDSSITVARLYTSNSVSLRLTDKVQILFDNKYSYLFALDMSEKNANHSASTHSSDISKIKNLLVTGHADGTINFWDASCPLLLLTITIQQQQSKERESPCTSSVTSLLLDTTAHILVSGHQDGLVRIIIFKKEQHLSETVFSFLRAKQGENYAARYVKLQGAIKYMGIDPEAKHLAIGTERGYVSVIQMEGSTVLYQTQIPGHTTSAIISLQFQTYIKNGLAKKILLVGREDCSVLALEESSGNAVSDVPIQPKKPSRALLLHVLDASYEGILTSGCQDTSIEQSISDATQKQALLVLCSENAVRLFALDSAVQGIKKVYGKKKLNGSCCHASIIYGPSSEVGLILVFTCGRIEIRSLPDLSLLDGFNVRDFAYSTLESPSVPRPICASSEGKIILVNGDQAVLFLSVLSYKESYRHLEQITQVYRKDVVSPKIRISNTNIAQKDKKKGILSMVKDLKGNKTSNTHENDSNGSKANISEELSSIFSVAHSFASDETKKSVDKSDEDLELTIDDIDLEDAEEKHKGINFTGLSKQKLGKKFNALKDKLKAKQEEKAKSPKKMQEEGKTTTTVDQIKQKYGFGANSTSDVSKVAANNVQNLS